MDVRTYLRCVSDVDRMLRGVSGRFLYDDVRVTQHQWHCGGAHSPCLRELRIRAWNGGSALRDIKNYE